MCYFMSKCAPLPICMWDIVVMPGLTVKLSPSPSMAYSEINFNKYSENINLEIIMVQNSCTKYPFINK